MKRVITVLSALLLAPLAALHAAEKPNPATNGTSADMWGGGTGAKANLVRGAWLKDSRFAMFVHWGLYSELGGNWNDKTYHGIAECIMNRAKVPAAEYEKVVGRFNQTTFDAREWVKLAKNAGMRYIMITSKHRDGFAMFKSAVSSFKRDPVKELADACRATRWPDLLTCPPSDGRVSACVGRGGPFR
jgi:hypothetical protein